jgi:transposase
MIPPARPGERKRSIDVPEVLNAIFYVLWTGCQWKALPKDLPPKSTAHYYFMLWDWDGTLERIHHALYVAVREQTGREASPSVEIIDSQSGKAAQKGALRSTRRASMRARRSRDASAISSSIRWACC